MSKTERVGLLLQLAQASLLENDPTGAMQALAQASEVDDDIPEIHHLRAIAYYMKKDLNPALDESRLAIKLAPNYSDANNTYGKILMDLGRLDEAVAPLVKSSSDPLYGDTFKPLTNLGILYYRKANYSRSREYLTRATEVSPYAACVAYYYLGHVDLKQSHVTDAIRDYTKATRRNCGEFGDARIALGIAYERNHDYDKARKLYLDVQKQFANTKVADQAMERLRYLP